MLSSLDLSYNIALCHYMMKQYAPALKHIADIIEKGIREHPGKLEFSCKEHWIKLVLGCSFLLSIALECQKSFNEFLIAIKVYFIHYCFIVTH